jgi:hypothetical protein
VVDVVVGGGGVVVVVVGGGDHDNALVTILVDALWVVRGAEEVKRHGKRVIVE